MHSIIMRKKLRPRSIFWLLKLVQQRTGEIIEPFKLLGKHAKLEHDQEGYLQEHTDII